MYPFVVNGVPGTGGGGTAGFGSNDGVAGLIGTGGRGQTGTGSNATGFASGGGGAGSNTTGQHVAGGAGSPGVLYVLRF
jgi:hypothetical protein